MAAEALLNRLAGMYILKPLHLLGQPLRVSLRTICAATNSSHKLAVNPKFQPLADDDLSYEILEVVWQASKFNQRKKGAHEARKTLYYGTSEFLVMAADTDPPTILNPLLSLAKEKKVPYVFVPSKLELGYACIVNGPVAACSITTSDLSPIQDNVQEAKEYLQEVIEKL